MAVLFPLTKYVLCCDRGEDYDWIMRKSELFLSMRALSMFAAVMWGCCAAG